jgi:hypothetical protein
MEGKLDMIWIPVRAHWFYELLHIKRGTGGLRKKPNSNALSIWKASDTNGDIFMHKKSLRSKRGFQ